MSERDVCINLISLAIHQAVWQRHQCPEGGCSTNRRVTVRGKLASRVNNPDAHCGHMGANFVPYDARPKILYVAEAKRAKFSVAYGMHWILTCAEKLHAHFAISCSDDDFRINDCTGLTQCVKRELQLCDFPSLEGIRWLFKQWQGLAAFKVDVPEQKHA